MGEDIRLEAIENMEVAVVDNVDNSIVNLPPKIQRFIHMYTTGQYTLVQLAELLEVHPNTLSNWLKRKEVKAIILDMQESTHDMVAIQLKALSTKATAKLSALVNSPIDGVALQAVKDILDRSGHKPKQEIKVDKTVTTFEQKLNTLIDDVIMLEVNDDGTYSSE